MNFKSIKKMFSGDKIKRIIFIFGIAGILIIFISSFIKLPDNSNKNTVADYKEQIQSSITEMLNNIEGVGECSVLLTIENSVEDVYLENSSTKTKEIEPVIRGVVVACGGGDDPIVVARVNEIVTKALNISSAKVCVTKLK